MPGRSTPPMPERSRTWRSSAFTSVPLARAGARVDDEAGRLVDDQQVGVLVDDRERDVLGLRLGAGRRGHVDGHRLRRAQPGRGARRFAVDEHVAVDDQGLQARTGERGQALREPDVEPEPARLVVRDQPLLACHRERGARRS